MSKVKKVSLFLGVGCLILICAFLGWVLTIIFEGERPVIRLDSVPEFISETQKIKVTVSDKRRGIKTLKISVNQEGRDIVLLEKSFPFKGLFNKEGVHQYEKEISIDPAKLNLAQGRVDFNIRVWDYSRRRGGDGNLSLSHHKMVVDTIPPAIRAISRMHYVTKGGSCLVIYRTSSDTVESGLYVNDQFFPGFLAGKNHNEGIKLCYFAVPSKADTYPSIYLWAKDRANNSSKANFNHRVRRKRFRKERMNISDRFLKKVLPYFDFYELDETSSDINKFLKINRELRKENQKVFMNLITKTSPEQLWEGAFLRLRKAATMAKFADKRFYYYKGKKVDEQIHLGVDLASKANAEVSASNSGRVLYAERLGIYGLTVIIDHGQGLLSTYSHLSDISVGTGDEIERGEKIGLTGKTGLAGGDHLHFGIIINGVFVNPEEWWDSHWIRDNITRKLDLLDK